MNFLAVDLMMDRLGIDLDERIDFWEKVRYIASHVIKEQREAQEAEARSQAKTKRR